MDTCERVNTAVPTKGIVRPVRLWVIGSGGRVLPLIIAPVVIHCRNPKQNYYFLITIL